MAGRVWPGRKGRAAKKLRGNGPRPLRSAKVALSFHFHPSHPVLSAARRQAGRVTAPEDTRQCVRGTDLPPPHSRFHQESDLELDRGGSLCSRG